MHLILTVCLSVLLFCSVADAQEQFESDTITTSGGDLTITFIGHGTLMFSYDGKVIHVDPWGRLADYTKLPKADIILVTHEHGDHLDPAAIEHARTEATILIYTEKCSENPAGGTVMKNGDTVTVQGLDIEAVPAYNIMHKRESGDPYHPKGDGNGYLITFGNKRVYVAGDTENIPEMNALKNIDIAFLPMNLPYTMSPEMVAKAARAFRPKILYPYHFGDTDTAKIRELLTEEEAIEVRIRNMK